jgi:hypothetical protein
VSPVRGRGTTGQAAVELALSLPLLALLALALLQVGLVVRDQVALTHATREAVREAVVTADPEAPRRAALAAAALDPDRLRVDAGPRGRPGTRLRVTLRYASPTDVPLIGPLLGDVHLSSTAAMRVES